MEEIDPALDALSLFCNDVLFCRIRYPSADNRIGSPPGCGDGGRRENYPSYVEISPENKESGPIRVLLASLFLTDLEERGTLIQTPSRVRLTNAWEITPPMLCPSTMLPLLAASRSVALSV